MTTSNATHLQILHTSPGTQQTAAWQAAKQGSKHVHALAWYTHLKQSLRSPVSSYQHNQHMHAFSQIPAILPAD